MWERSKCPQIGMAEIITSSGICKWSSSETSLLIFTNGINWEMENLFIVTSKDKNLWIFSPVLWTSFYDFYFVENAHCSMPNTVQLFHK